MRADEHAQEVILVLRKGSQAPFPVLAATRHRGVFCAQSMSNSALIASLLMRAMSLACAASIGVAADEGATDNLTAQQILEKMATTYANCKSYRDSGVVTNDFGPHTEGDRYPRHINFKPFRTAFVRPDQFRFEYDDTTPDKSYIIWAKAGETRTWWHFKPGVEDQPSLGIAIAGATGVSGGSAQTIPALLLLDRIGGRKLTSLTDLVRLPDETLDGTSCFKLEGKFADRPTTLWLEKATYLVRRVDQNTGLTRDTTVYRADVNKEIPAKELELNAPSTR